MLHAFYPDDKTTIVTGALNREKFDEWFATLVHQHFTDARETDVFEQMSEPLFDGFATTVFVIEHASAEDQQAFKALHDLQIWLKPRAVNRHQEMLDYSAPDPYDAADTRTVAELCGITDEDRHDRRTDEEKAQDAETKKMMDAMRKRGEISEDSFAPVKSDNDGKVTVTDVRVVKNADGSQEVDNILARKDGTTITDHEKEVILNATLRVDVGVLTESISVRWGGNELVGSQSLVNKVYGGDTFKPELDAGYLPVWTVTHNVGKTSRATYYAESNEVLADEMHIDDDLPQEVETNGVMIADDRTKTDE